MWKDNINAYNENLFLESRFWPYFKTYVIAWFIKYKPISKSAKYDLFFIAFNVTLHQRTNGGIYWAFMWEGRTESVVWENSFIKT